MDPGSRPPALQDDSPTRPNSPASGLGDPSEERGGREAAEDEFAVFADFDGDVSPAAVAAAMVAASQAAGARKYAAGAMGLAAFLRAAGAGAATPRGDPRTNVIDQGARRTYAFPPAQLRELFGHLEACRLEGTVTHLSERQGTPQAPASGLMLDFDLLTCSEAPPPFDARQLTRVGAAVAGAVGRAADLAAPSRAAALHVFVTAKPAPAPVPDAAARERRWAAAWAPAPPPGPPPAELWKYGFHVLVPGVQLPRPLKRFVLEGLRKDPSVLALLAEMGAVGEPGACLDAGSVSVPPLFLGCCKRSGEVAYRLAGALEVTLDVPLPGAPPLAFAPPPVVRVLPPAELREFNLVAELSLGAEAAYPGGRPPLVRKRPFPPAPGLPREVAEAAAAAAAALPPAAGDGGGAEAAAAAAADEGCFPAERGDGGLGALLVADAEARHLHGLLDLLGADVTGDRNRWRDVVYALAGSGEHLRPLAEWFSRRCPHRTRPGSREDDLPALWAEALGRQGTPGAAARPLTGRSIAFWARAADPARYAEVTERAYFTTLLDFVYKHEGDLQHYMVAKVLQAMLGGKFCVDVVRGGGERPGKAYSWFEFVIPGQAMAPGEVWKWRQEAEPDGLQIYISEHLSRVFDQVSEHVAERAANAADEKVAAYYRVVGKNFARSKRNLFNDVFKNGVVRQAHCLFRRRGFAEALDTHPHLFGVLNGVLHLGDPAAPAGGGAPRRPTLIDHFHEFPVSRFTRVAYRPFDPAEPWTALALRAVAAIFPEPDARDFILFHAAQGLCSSPKEGVLLFLVAGGQNGKTSFLRWVARALGPAADKFNIQLMACEREDADRPNSAMMRFKHLNWAYAEESNKSQVLNTARMKEMINAGEVSGRDLNSKQETFTMHCNAVAASQYNFIIPTTDHGTWRRIRYYSCKTKFRRDPNPADPFEQADDQRFVREFPDSPGFQSAFLSILAHYYHRLATEFRGELKNVSAPTIEAETEAFRVSQDTVHRWICETVVLSPESALAFSLPELAEAYSRWYVANVDRRLPCNSEELIAQLLNSSLEARLAKSPNGTRLLTRCRLLAGGGDLPGPGEEFLAAADLRGRRSAAEWDAARRASFEALRARNSAPWWEGRPPAPGLPPAFAPAPPCAPDAAAAPDAPDALAAGPAAPPSPPARQKFARRGGGSASAEAAAPDDEDVLAALGGRDSQPSELLAALAAGEAEEEEE